MNSIKLQLHQSNRKLSNPGKYLVSWCAGDCASIFQENLNHADHTGHPAASVSQKPDLYAQKHSQTNKAHLLDIPDEPYVRLAAALTSCSQYRTINNPQLYSLWVFNFRVMMHVWTFGLSDR